MGPSVAVSWSYTLEHFRPYVVVGLVAVAVVAVAVVAGGAPAGGQVDVVLVRTVGGTGQGRWIRRDLGHRPRRLAHRTPVLYSRNQSRTNIVPRKEIQG